MMKKRSAIRLVQSDIEIKHWMRDLPSVDEVRPAWCPCCRAASQEPGRALGLHGHGVRERQVRGPLAPWGRPTTVWVGCRRYRCQHCSAVMLVVPRGIVCRRLFSIGAIAWALWLFGVEQLPPAQVREGVSPWQVLGATAAAGWAQLGRWARDVRRGRLLGNLPAAVGAGLRAVAQRTAMALAALAPPAAWDAPPPEKLWQGALHVGGVHPDVSDVARRAHHRGSLSKRR